MFKSNHVQQSTEAYVKLSRGHQHMPEKGLVEYVDEPLQKEWQLSSIKTLKTLCKWAPVRWWVPVRWWASPHFSGRSGYSAGWQFMSMKNISLRKAGVFDSLVYLAQLCQPGDYSSHMWDGFSYCNKKHANHCSGTKWSFELKFICIHFTTLLWWRKMLCAAKL